MQNQYMNSQHINQSRHTNQYYHPVGPEQGIKFFFISWVPFMGLMHSSTPKGGQYELSPAFTTQCALQNKTNTRYKQTSLETDSLFWTNYCWSLFSSLSTISSYNAYCGITVHRRVIALQPSLLKSNICPYSAQLSSEHVHCLATGKFRHWVSCSVYPAHGLGPRTACPAHQGN